jgi:5-methylthioadenosine/S-adenosylhomocysteine deaminase
MGAVGSGGFLRLFEAGVCVSLGTDAAAISRFLDMIRVMYLAATAHKDIACDPLAAGCYKALEMATIEGARAIHLDHQIGSLEVSKQADIVVADMDGPAWQPDPFFNPVANLIYAADASSVRHVIVRGESLVEDRVLLAFDCREVWQAARAARQALLSRLGIKLTPQWPVS